MRKIKGFFIYKKDKEGKVVEVPLTIMRNLKYLNEYIVRFIVIENYNHYTQWCEVRDLEVDDYDSMYRYVMNVREQELDKFVAIKVKFKPEGIFSILRCFNKCLPVDCSYETDFEHEYMEDIFNDIIEKFNLEDKIKEKE